MGLLTIILVVLGLCLFEVVCSLDNAIINAQVLSTMGAKARRWFLTWGIFFAVFVVRFLLPWILVWVVMPGLGPIGALTATFRSEPHVVEALESSAPPLLFGGGVFLVLLFLYWMFIDEKNASWRVERILSGKKRSFLALSVILLVLLIFTCREKAPSLIVAALIGYAAFFLMQFIKKIAEGMERKFTGSGASDAGKIVYLEMLDTTFSIDGVLGAFAFTLSIPLILIGNGIGAVVVRQITIGSIAHIKRFRYLKNGAMYSVFMLGTVMVLEGFGVHVPKIVSPVLTFAIVGYFFFRSWQERKSGKTKLEKEPFL